MKTLDLSESGKRVRRCREHLGYTREQFAEQVGISPQFLAEIENGKKGMSADTLYKICIRFDLSANYILLGQAASDTLSDPVQTILKNFPEKYVLLTEDIIHAIAKAAADD